MLKAFLSCMNRVPLSAHPDHSGCKSYPERLLISVLSAERQLMCLAKNRHIFISKRYCTFFKCLFSCRGTAKARWRILNETVNFSFKHQSPVGEKTNVQRTNHSINISKYTLQKDTYFGRKLLKQRELISQFKRKDQTQSGKKRDRAWPTAFLSILLQPALAPRAWPSSPFKARGEVPVAAANPLSPTG